MPLDRRAILLPEINLSSNPNQHCFSLIKSFLASQWLLNTSCTLHVTLSAEFEQGFLHLFKINSWQRGLRIALISWGVLFVVLHYRRRWRYHWHLLNAYRPLPKGQAAVLFVEGRRSLLMRWSNVNCAGCSHLAHKMALDLALLMISWYWATGIILYDWVHCSLSLRFVRITLVKVGYFLLEDASEASLLELSKMWWRHNGLSQREMTAFGVTCIEKLLVIVHDWGTTFPSICSQYFMLSTGSSLLFQRSEMNLGIPASVSLSFLYPSTLFLSWY